MRSSRVGSALPPDFDFQVSKTWFSLDSSALFAFFFSIRFHASIVSQGSTVLLRVSTQENTLLSASRTVYKKSMLHKVESSERNRKFACLERTARKHLMTSQSRISTLKTALLSDSRIVCRDSMLHKSDTCGRF